MTNTNLSTAALLGFSTWMTACALPDASTEAGTELEPIDETVEAVSYGPYRLTLNDWDERFMGRSYDFAQNLWPTDPTHGDVTFMGGELYALYGHQRGIARLGTCASLSEIPNHSWLTYRAGVNGGYKEYSWPLVAGECYAVRTRAPFGEVAVLQILSITDTQVNMNFKVIDTGLKSAWFASGPNWPVSFSYATSTSSTAPWQGDFHYENGNFLANYNGQAYGLIDAGVCDEYSMGHGQFSSQRLPPEDQYVWSGVPVVDQHCYWVLTANRVAYVFYAAVPGEDIVSISHYPGAGTQM